MNTITNNEFKTLYTLVERVSSECSKRFKFKTITYLSMTEFNSLSFIFIIKYKGEIHTVERNLHRMEIMTANYEIYTNLMNYIDSVFKELKKKIEEDISPKESKELKSLKHAAEIIANLSDDLPRAKAKSKELKDTTFITVCDACLTASCWNGDFMCQQSLHAGTVEKTVKKLRKLNLENPDNRKKQFCGDFDEL